MVLESPLKLLAVLALTMSTLSALAATPLEDATEHGATSPDITTSILEEQQTTESRVVGLSRFRVSYPQRVSGALGAMWVRQPTSYDCSAVCDFKGPFVQAEPGLSGGQLSVGYAALKAEKRNNKHFLSRTFLGYGIRAALLRTWNDASLTPPDQTLLGVEADLSIIHINFSLAVFHHVGSGDPDDPWIVSGGIGVGF